MKLSELITELQTLYEENGDLPVFIRDAEWWRFEDISSPRLDFGEENGSLKKCTDMSTSDPFVWFS